MIDCDIFQKRAKAKGKAGTKKQTSVDLRRAAERAKASEERKGFVVNKGFVGKFNTGLKTAIKQVERGAAFADAAKLGGVSKGALFKRYHEGTRTVTLRQFRGGAPSFLNEESHRIFNTVVVAIDACGHPGTFAQLQKIHCILKRREMGLSEGEAPNIGGKDKSKATRKTIMKDINEASVRVARNCHKAMREVANLEVRLKHFYDVLDEVLKKYKVTNPAHMFVPITYSQHTSLSRNCTIVGISMRLDSCSPMRSWSSYHRGRQFGSTLNMSMQQSSSTRTVLASTGHHFLCSQGRTRP